MTDGSREEKDLTSLNASSCEGPEAGSKLNFDIQASLLAAKNAMDEDMKNLSIVHVDAANIQRLSQMFDISPIQAEATLKANNNSVEKSINDLLLNFSEFQNSKIKFQE